MITRFAAAGVLACAAAGAAHAGPLADALARGDAAAIAALRAQADDGARCTLGAIYARRGDLTRGGLYLAGCEYLALPDDIAAPVQKLARETLRKLRDGDLASIHVVSPEGAVVECTALPGEPFTVPATLYVKPGRYEVSATLNGQRVAIPVAAEARKRSPVVLALPVEKQPVAQQDQQVSFDDEALADQETAPPPPQKHPTLIPKKYRPETAARDPLEAPAEDDDGGGGLGRLDDPLAARTTARPPRRQWLGVRLGGGMFDDGRAAARPGVALALTARHALRDQSGPFLSGRVDWTRRGGDPEMGASIDALAASAGAGVTLLHRGALALAILGQLRGELRLDTARAEEAVRRAGLGAAAGVELALPATPITAGLRFEQGITELVDGARDRAFLLEIGVDWR